MITLANNFPSLFRYGKYRNQEYVVKRITGTSVFVLNKPMWDPRDKAAYRQVMMEDGSALAFVGTASDWSPRTVTEFVDRYRSGQIIATTTTGKGYITIPRWRVSATRWLDRQNLAYHIVDRYAFADIGSIYPEAANTHTDPFRSPKRGWIVIKIDFRDKETYLHYKEVICVPDRCWSFDDADMFILYFAFYESSYQSLKERQKQDLKVMTDLDGVLMSALWTNDEEETEQAYRQYTGYLSRVNGKLYYDWGTSPAPDTSTFQFLRDLVCVPPKSGPLTVAEAVDKLVIGGEE